MVAPTGNPMPEEIYERGQLAAHVQNLRESQQLLLNEFKDHRIEEREVWTGLNERLDSMQGEIHGLDIWRAKVLGLAAGISAVLTAVINWLIHFFTKMR